MFTLKELGAELARKFAGDLTKRDIAIVVRDDEGKDKHMIVLPDPIVEALFDWMQDDDMDAMVLLKRMVDGVYDYSKGEDEIVVMSLSVEGKKARSIPLGGAFGARIMYRKLFAK